MSGEPRLDGADPPARPTTGAARSAAFVPPRGRARALDAGAAWLGASRMGLVAMALAVGVIAGLGAVAFRWLIYAFTWLASGHQQFGQQGRVASTHLPWLGVWFLLLVPVLGGLLYGPLVQRFAPEARGHGVPEVMLAVAENGGRIRPPVTIVKALASAICIATGGSVGREGPIVQIGSALASTLGQLVRMSEARLRVIVACGAAGAIAATFNAPITGLFFGFEIVLREFSLDALLGTILAAVSADLVSRAFLGSGPFFSRVPHDLLVVHDYDYLLIALLGVGAGLLGVGFKTVLYALEDRVEAMWRGRPEWARPAVGGLALGALLLALPQMYGVGYPVMDKIFAGEVALWLVVVLMLGKVVASSLTLSIGGSGGVFAPSLFTGAAGGTAFGILARHVFGADAGPPALYAVVAMGGVFAAATQAPLTAIASVAEMTGNFGLTLPIMLAAGVATGLSKRLSDGSIYTTKLLRRGIDIERPRSIGALEQLSVADVMQPLASPATALRAPHESASGADDGRPREPAAAPTTGSHGRLPRQWERLVGPVSGTRTPQALFADEDLQHALRQLVLYGREGLPVLSHDGAHVRGWITGEDVLRVLGERIGSYASEVERGAVAADIAAERPDVDVHVPTTPLRGYEIVELAVAEDSPAAGRRVGEIEWPPGCLVVAIAEGREVVAARRDAELQPGERVILLAPSDAAHA
ncbi:MAG TPA: chloride channel protein [Solirubrobacteraceae bacterium]|nr:chloride channel protein [Solirubrobacteraceae bacterium]